MCYAWPPLLFTFAKMLFLDLFVFFSLNTAYKWPEVPTQTDIETLTAGRLLTQLEQDSSPP